MAKGGKSELTDLQFIGRPNIAPSTTLPPNDVVVIQHHRFCWILFILGMPLVCTRQLDQNKPAPGNVACSFRDFREICVQQPFEYARALVHICVRRQRRRRRRVRLSN